MEFQPYPRHLHGPGGAFLVVHNDAERDAGVKAGWYLWPVEVPGALEAPATEHAAAQAEAVPAADEIPADLSTFTIPQAEQLIQVVDNGARLQQWLEAEQAGKKRKRVIAALEARQAFLAEG